MSLQTRLSGYSPESEGLIKMGKIVAKFKDDNDRILAGQKLKDYYLGEQTRWLQVSYKRLFPPTDVREKDLTNPNPPGAGSLKLMGSYNPVTLPLVSKVAFKAFRVYKKAPKREIKGADGTILKIDHNFWYPTKYDMQLKEADRLKGLFKMILERVEYIKERKEFRSVFYTPDEINVIQHPQYPDEALAFRCTAPELENTTGQANERTYYLWFHPTIGEFYPDREQYAGQMYRVDHEDNIITQDYDGGKVTSIPILVWPWIVHRETMIDSDSFFAPLDESFVNVNELINLILTRLGMKAGIVLGQQVWFKGSRFPDEMTLGVDFALNLGTDGAAGTLNLQADLMKYIDDVKGIIKLWGWAENVSVQESLDGGGNVSGFSLVVRNLDTMEVHEDRVESARAGEEERLRIMKAYSQVYKDIPPIPQDAVLSINFAELNLPIDKREELIQMKLEIELLGYPRLKDFYLKYDPDLAKLSDDELFAYIVKAQEQMRQLSSKSGGISWIESIFLPPGQNAPPQKQAPQLPDMSSSSVSTSGNRERML